MGYEHRVFSAVCVKCDSRYGWSLRSNRAAPRRFTCKCGVRNILGKLPEWSNVPRTLYLGHEKHNQLKLHAVPPEAPNEYWAQPYSIRSFVSQASRRFGGCTYATSMTGTVMGEAVFSDRCMDSAAPFGGDDPCHLVAGFTLGEPTCKLWEQISVLCQTEVEKRFLYWFLGLVKDRQFPMLIPQARIGIAERRRPDFVLFVPLHYWHYKWYAVQLDAAHPGGQHEADRLRDAEITVHGYEVISLRPEQQGYLEEVKRLAEQIEREMGKADADIWSVTVDIPVTGTENPDEDDMPF